MSDSKFVVDKPYCMSSFLMYRRVVDQQKCFVKDERPKTISLDWKKIPIYTAQELENHLRLRVQEITKNGSAALALSGGIDSAILAKFMPKGSTAYTFKCVVDGKEVIDESIQAGKYARECGLKHKIIEVHWSDMERTAPILMKHKKAPMHSIETQIYLGGLEAKKDGFSSIIYGETADVNYGGLSNILSKDWTTGEFIDRYAYLKPWYVLKNPKVDFSPVLDYVNNGYVDVHKYLSRFDIIESLNSYHNACEVAGIKFEAPYADTYLAVPLDYKRIREGDNKYLIREIYQKLYPGWDVPKKIPMPRPMDEWLANWEGPIRSEFIQGCQEKLTGDQKWLTYSLERFLDLLDQEDS